MKEQEVLKIKVEKKDQKVEEYKFDPIKGHPYLHWRGKRPFKSTQYFPAQPKESYGTPENNWTNEIYWGDNLQVMSHLLKQYRGQIDLIYIDPPFDSNADFKKTIKLRGEKTKNDHNAFEEKQYTDIWLNDDYLQFMYERLILIRELMSTDSSIYVHMDEKRVNLMRLMMDEIFGQNMFQREIIWSTKTSSGFKTSANNWIRTHDTILYYSKTHDKVFNKQYWNYSDEYLSRFHKKDKDGRRFRDDRSSGEPQYLDELKGIPMGDVWADIMSFQQAATSSEIVNYPTQKPEKLLERIILSSSNPGDLVFDCFMGSGTTQAVAMKLGRKFIGADINLGAIQTSTSRLIKIIQELNINGQTNIQSENEEIIDTFYTGFNVYNVNNYDLFKNPVEAKELLIDALEINPIVRNNTYDGEKDGRMVKIMPINRIVTKADLGELITGFDYKSFERKKSENPNKPVEKILIVCMGHESDLAASLQKNVGYLLDIEVVDILRDRAELEFKRDSEARIIIKAKCLVIESFYPMNLLQKLSIMKEDVGDWKELVESIMIDWNYDGKLMKPDVIDLPEKNEVVRGEYKLPNEVGRIKIKITDLLSESFETEVKNA